MDDVKDLISELLGYNVNISDSEKTHSLSKNVYQPPFKYTEIIGHFAPSLQNASHPKGHFGVDLRASRGESVHPIAPGRVRATGSNPKAGLFVSIDHENGVISFYGHLDSISTKQGDKVNFDTVIGAVGDTGNAKGAAHHCHHEISINGKRIDPLTLFGKPIESSNKQADIEQSVIKILNKFAKKL